MGLVPLLRSLGSFNSDLVFVPFQITRILFEFRSIEGSILQFQRVPAHRRVAVPLGFVLHLGEVGALWVDLMDSDKESVQKMAGYVIMECGREGKELRIPQWQPKVQRNILISLIYRYHKISSIFSVDITKTIGQPSRVGVNRINQKFP